MWMGSGNWWRGSTKDRITLAEFAKLDLRVGTVRSVSEVKGADRLYRLTIDVGDDILTTVAGIKAEYSSQQLVGQQVCVVANLEPVAIKGITSECMLLAAKGEPLSLLVSDREVPPGTVIG